MNDAFALGTFATSDGGRCDVIACLTVSGLDVYGVALIARDDGLFDLDRAGTAALRGARAQSDDVS